VRLKSPRRCGSAQIYNERADYERLACAVLQLVAEAEAA
jgi:hypothetical protein